MQKGTNFGIGHRYDPTFFTRGNPGPGYYGRPILRDKYSGY